MKKQILSILQLICVFFVMLFGVFSYQGLDMSKIFGGWCGTGPCYRTITNDPCGGTGCVTTHNHCIGQLGEKSCQIGVQVCNPTGTGPCMLGANCGCN
jgi:hypothetical protein